MLTKDEIEAHLNAISSVIASFDTLEATATVDYMATIVSIQALATEAQAAAKFRLLEATDAELDRQAKLAKNDQVAPSIKKLRADSKCREMHYLYEKSQRLSSAVSHTIDACRTKISYLKQEMENTKYS